MPKTSIRPSDDERLNTKLLLQTLAAVKKGDFTVRLPSSWNGIDGKIADAFNDIVAVSERRARETARVSHAVGKEGKLKQRMACYVRDTRVDPARRTQGIQVRKTPPGHWDLAGDRVTLIWLGSVSGPLQRRGTE